jgi:RHS repeat-associated protein
VEDYYPFGLTFNSYQRDSSMPDQYLYNGKELQDELSLGWLDYGARMYMPELGRWGVVDPLSENMRRFSVYNYCWDNPLIFVDPDGMFGDVYNQQGTWVGTDNQDDKKKYVVKDGADPKDAVKGNTIDKTKVIEFVSGKDARAKMLEIANQDKADNSREYGGVISQSGDLIETSGEDGNIDYQKAKDPNAQENLDKLDGKVDKFHSHQSTQRDEEMNTSNGTVLVPVNKWNQKPSDGDKDGLKNNQTLYVFGMGLRSSPSHNEGAERVNIVYKDSNGNLSTASLPISRWVDQKERR